VQVNRLAQIQAGQDREHVGLQYRHEQLEADEQDVDYCRKEREQSDTCSKAAEQQRQLAETLAEQTRAAEREIGAAKERAFTEIRNVAVDVARSVAEKLTGSATDEAKLMPAVDRALAERAR